MLARCVLCGVWTQLEEQSVSILLDMRPVAGVRELMFGLIASGILSTLLEIRFAHFVG